MSNLSFSSLGVGVSEVINVLQSIDVIRSAGNPSAEIGLAVAQRARIESVLPQGIAGGPTLENCLYHGILFASAGPANPSLSLKR